MIKREQLISPMLIEALDHGESEDRPNNSILSVLPGKYTQMVADHMTEVKPLFKSNLQILTCGDCGKKGKYDLGKVVINPENDKKLPFENYLQCTGYFRCEYCNSAGHWNMPNQMMFEVTAAMLSSFVKVKNERYSIGMLQAFDGSSHRFSTDAEEHILSRIITEGQNAFYWNRLGNTYKQGGRPDLAALAFEQSIRIDDCQLESHYTLANILFQIGEFKGSAFHYDRVIHTAQDYTLIEAEKLRDLVAGSLQDLFFIYDDQEKFSSKLPTGKELQAGKMDAEDSAKFIDLDPEIFPDEFESFFPMAEMYMGETLVSFRKNNKF